MDTIGIGIIGWGFMGRTHAFAAQNLPLFYPGVTRPKLVGIASRRMESALEAQQTMGFTYATDDWRSLLAREDIRAVSICTPNDLHEEMLLAALKAGKHVYLDKPASTSAASARRMLDVSRNSSLHVQMAFHNRFFPCVMRARQLMDEGRIGRILSFRITYLHSGSIDPGRPAGWKSEAGSAGVLLDLGSHALDMLSFLGGEIQSLCSRNMTLYPARPRKGGGRLESPGEDAVFMLAQLRGGGMGTIEASKIVTGAMDDFRVEIGGERGALRFDLMNPNWLYFYDNTRPEQPLGGERGWTRIESAAAYPPPGGQFLPHKNSIGWVRAHVASYYHFIDSLSRGIAPQPSLAQGVYVQELMDAAMRSHKTGGWVTLP